MSRFRTHLMALLGGAMLLALSVSGALGHASAGDFGGAKNHGQAVSAYVHSLVFGYEDASEEEPAEGDVDEDADSEDTDVDEETVDEDADSEEGAGNSHGKCVSEVAHSDEVGGKNENHGGAMSEAARVTCWEDPAEDAADESAVSAVDADASDAGPGKSKAAHDRGHKGDRG